MSVLMQFSMFPTDKGESASPYVARIINLLQQLNIDYQLNAMGTIIETETLAEAQQIVAQAYEQLAVDCTRVYCTVTFDIREGKMGRRLQKIRSIEEKVGQVKL